MEKHVLLRNTQTKTKPLKGNSTSQTFLNWLTDTSAEFKIFKEFASKQQNAKETMFYLRHKPSVPFILSQRVPHPEYFGPSRL